MVLVVGWFSLVIEAFILKLSANEDLHSKYKTKMNFDISHNRQQQQRLELPPPPTISRCKQRNFLHKKTLLSMSSAPSLASLSSSLLSLFSILALFLLLSSLCDTLLQRHQQNVIVLAAPSSTIGNTNNQFVLTTTHRRYPIIGSSNSASSASSAMTSNSNGNYNSRRESIFSPVAAAVVANTISSNINNKQQQQPQHNFHPSLLLPQSLPLSPSTINNYHAVDQQQQQHQQQQLIDQHHHQMLPAAESLLVERRRDDPSSVEQLNPLVLPSCQLPATWAGKWYQMGTKDPIRFTNTEISERGVCRDRKDDKFLFEHRTTRCLVCMVINERHINVLQYKESPTECDISSSTYASMLQDGHTSHEILDNLCSSITGDAQLESLFRLDTSPIECPIIGQYTFTYDNCKVIPSSLESCIDKKQLNFKFNACPDVGGSESKREVLKCYADWTEGSNYYMIGRLEPTTANNNVDRGKFRCFIYEKLPDGQTISMAQSLEETCIGLISASEGPRTMRITAKPPTSRCNFPDYITKREGWVSVDNSLIYMFNQNSSNYQVKETREGNVIEEATCIKQVLTPQQQIARRQHQHSDNLQQYQSYHPSYSDTGYDQFLVQATKNCQTLTYCVRFHKRASSLIQIEFFQRSHHNDDTCSDIHPAAQPTHIITLTSAEQQPCPFNGIYSIEAPMESDLSYNPSDLFVCPRQSFLAAHCDDASLMHIHSKCNTKTTIKNLYCLGSFYWAPQGSHVLLLSDDDRQRYQAIIQRDGTTITTILQQQQQQQQFVGYPNQALASDTLQYQPASTYQPSRFNNNNQDVLQQQQQQQQQLSGGGAIFHSSSAVINMSISPITSPHFKIAPRNAMRVRLIRKSPCIEVSRSQIISSSSSISSSSAPASSSSAVSMYHSHHRTNSVNLLLITLMLSLYHCLRFLYFCNNSHVRR